MTYIMFWNLVVNHKGVKRTMFKFAGQSRFYVAAQDRCKTGARCIKLVVVTVVLLKKFELYKPAYRYDMSNYYVSSWSLF